MNIIKVADPPQAAYSGSGSGNETTPVTDLYTYTGYCFMYNRAQKVAQELRKARATGELSCAITTRQTTLHRCCAVPASRAHIEVGICPEARSANYCVSYILYNLAELAAGLLAMSHTYSSCWVE